MPELDLAEEFELPQREDWRKLVDNVLKGADFDKRLVWKSHDNLQTGPLYDEPIHLQIPGRFEQSWKPLQRVDIPDTIAANSQILEDLNAGAAGLSLVAPQSVAACGFGFSATSPADYDRLLQGVHLDMIPVRLDAGWNARDAVTALLAVYEKRAVDIASVDLCLGLDPLGAFALTGLMRETTAVQTTVGATLNALLNKGFAGTAFVGDGRVYHNAGASEAQELACVLASVVTYMRWCEAAGIAPDVAFPYVALVLNVDADMFMSAAKLRAARLLWARLQETTGTAATPLKLHAETSWRMMTRHDPHVNLLRLTAATFAAGIAGADTLTTLPFTCATGLPDAFARRMARNTQTILIEESHLGHVQDPGAGSGFMDQGALDLAAKAWSLFQNIEKQGGMIPALTNGFIDANITKVRTARTRNIATRREPITGISEFPDTGELPVAVMDVAPKPFQMPGTNNAETCQPLVQQRLSVDYEGLRDISDAVLAFTGARPSVFMANLGHVSDFTARAMWAGNVFEAAGIEATRNEGFKSAHDAAEAFSADNADVVVICSSDSVYSDYGVQAVTALKKAGARHIYLAGQHSDALQDAGVDSFVHIGCDMIELLSQAHEILRIEK